MKMKIDLLAGLDLRASSACGTALEAKDRPEGGLARGNQRLFSQMGEALREPDGRNGLAFASRGGAGGCYENQLSSARKGFVLEQVQTNLGAVASERLVEIFWQAQFLGNHVNRQ